MLCYMNWVNWIVSFGIGSNTMSTENTEDLASGDTATWVGLGDLHNLLLSAEVL